MRLPPPSATLAAKLAEIQELGGKAIVSPTRIGDGMSFAMFADPEGTVIGLLRETGASGPPGDAA